MQYNSKSKTTQKIKSKIWKLKIEKSNLILKKSVNINPKIFF